MPGLEVGQDQRAAVSVGLPRWPGRVLLVGLALNMFAGEWYRVGVPLPLDRVALLAALALLWRERRRWRDSIGWRPIHGVMVAFLALAVVSGLAVGSVLQSGGFFALLDRVAIPFLLFALAPAFFPEATDRRWLLRGLVLVGLYMSVTGILSVTGPSALLFPHYIADPTAGIGYGRARGPSLEAVGTGLDVIVCGLAAAVVGWRERGGWRWLGSATVATSAVAVVLSQTRSIWLGAFVALAVVAVHERRARRVVPVLLLVTALVAGAMLTLVPGLLASSEARLTTVRSIDDRTTTNAAAVRMVLERPLTGVGWAEFLNEVGSNVRQPELGPITAVHIEAHNVFLARAAELGVPGLLLWAVLVLMGPLRLLVTRVRSAEAVGVYIVAVGSAAAWFVASMAAPLSQPLPNYLVWLLAGVALAQSDGRRRSVTVE